MNRVEQAKALRERIDAAVTREDLEAQADELRAALAEVEAQIVPAWKQPSGAHDAYPLGAKVFHQGRSWTSTVAANVWEPGVVPGVWT